MTKTEKTACSSMASMLQYAENDTEVGYIVKGFNSLARAARTEKSRNEVIEFAASLPAVARHAEFACDSAYFN